MPNIRLQPSIFSKCFFINPIKFTERSVVLAHNRVLTAAKAGLQAVGGPELRGIRIEVHNAAGFEQRFRETTNIDTKGYRFNGAMAFTLHGYENEQLYWTIFYNADGLQRLNKVSPIAGRIMAHEIGTTIYGAEIERIYRFFHTQSFSVDQPIKKPQDRVSNASIQLQMASEGCASYLSSFPFKESEILEIENLLADPNRERVDGQNILEDANNIHYGIHLVLLKVELAFGMEQAIRLMQKLPGFNIGGGKLSFNVVYGFWREYLRACRELRHIPIPESYFNQEFGIGVQKA